MLTALGTLEVKTALHGIMYTTQRHSQRCNACATFKNLEGIALLSQWYQSSVTEVSSRYQRKPGLAEGGKWRGGGGVGPEGGIRE